MVLTGTPTNIMCFHILKASFPFLIDLRCATSSYIMRIFQDLRKLQMLFNIILYIHDYELKPSCSLILYR